MFWIALCTWVLVAMEYFGVLSSRTPRTPKWSSSIWIVVLVGCYCAQLATIAYAAGHQYPMEAWRLAMPFAVIDDRGLPTANGDVLTGVMLALGALESYALLALYRSRVSQAAVLTGCGVLLVCSLAAPALMSFDLYGYVHDSFLGLSAYDPPATPFPGEYHVFDLWFDGPSVTLYGPLWLAIVKLVTAVAPTLLTKILALRAFNVALYLAILFGLKAYGLPQRVRTIAALNPGLMLEYVANGHNDIIAIALIVFAANFVRRRETVAGLGLIAVAGLVKLPYAVLGLPVLAAIRPLWLRVMWGAALLGVVVSFSWIGGGSAYFSTLFGHVTARPEDMVHRLAGVTALGLLVFAFFGGRRLRTTPWLLPTLASSIFASYYIWGLPYALVRRRVLSYVLVCFPFVAVLFETAFERWWELILVLPFVTLVSIFAPDKPIAPGPRPRKTRGKRRKRIAGKALQA